MGIVLITALFALVLAFVLGLALGFFKQVFAVAEDPLTSRVRACLPGANCGACGFPGCDGYAAAIVAGKAGVGSCSVGGEKTAAALSAVMGMGADAAAGAAAVKPAVAVVCCRGFRDKAPLKGEYTGVPSCRAAKISSGGTKLCAWACMGFGDCVKACAFGALSMGGDGIPVIDREKCVGCKRCTAECPQGIIRDIAKDAAGPLPRCSNRNPLKAQVIKTCKNGCIKCELCVKNCPQSALTMKNGLPEVDRARCVACGTCAQKCPTRAMALWEAR